MSEKDVAPAVTEAQRVGFEAALDRRNANWRKDWTDAHIDGARFFYMAAVHDTTVFVNHAIHNMQEGYGWLGNNITNTTRETNTMADAVAGVPGAAGVPAEASPVADAVAPEALVEAPVEAPTAGNTDAETTA